MQDPEAHVDAVAADLEYFRTKRLEPRILHYTRRGLVTLYDLLRAERTMTVEPPRPQPPEGLEQRVRALEDRLDALVADILTASVRLPSGNLVTDDLRRERGDYDEFFRVAKRPHEGSLEQRMSQLEDELSDCEHLIRTFLTALVLTGRVTDSELQEQRERVTGQGHRNGARIVARAWVDEEFKQRLLRTGRQAVRELGVPPGKVGKLAVAEDTDEIHHVVVCTLCSCYPTDLLGSAPWWYRTDEYRQRIIEDPRETLKEMFGFEPPDDRTIVVRDSTSDVRWMVLPDALLAPRA
jgi:nitrile hydratase subunit alpha